METKEITRMELKKKLDRKEDLVLINVLSRESFERMRIPGSVSVPLEGPDFLRRVQELVPDKKKPIVVYCASSSGQASPNAARVLMSAGYENVVDYKGGMADWMEGNLPIERSTEGERPVYHGPPPPKHKEAEAEKVEGEEGGEGGEAKEEGKGLAHKKCKPCEGGVPPMSTEQALEYLSQVEGWEYRVNRIQKEFKFKDFREGMEFVNKVAELAEEQGHHPDIYISHNRVRVELWTHAIGGLSENDFIMAAKIALL